MVFIKLQGSDFVCEQDEEQLLIVLGLFLCQIAHRIPRQYIPATLCDFEQLSIDLDSV